MRFRIPPELQALRDLFHIHDPAPDRMLAAGYAAADLAREWRGSGALELVGDSADVPAPAKVRAGHRPESRVLTFAMPGRIIEMDLVPTTPGMLSASGMVISRAGQGVPAGDVALRHPGGHRQGGLDEHGGFRVDDVPAGPLSVVFRPTRSTPVVADWFVC
jgi:hypothetical protein